MVEGDIDKTVSYTFSLVADNELDLRQISRLVAEKLGKDLSASEIVCEHPEMVHQYLLMFSAQCIFHIANLKTAEMS